MYVLYTGVAVYFHPHPLPHQNYKSGDDNNSDDSRNECPRPTNDHTPLYESPSNQQQQEQHWLVVKLVSIIKYSLFGVFVLVCNKIRRQFRHSSLEAEVRVRGGGRSGEGWR